ncbi:hypothetical protein [Paraburkholderia sp. RL17-347-BIC-D]|uniref:hypothetical protein n=1 Tax=Paraburkholderia sp. RL17-347-BIC-D TaxID=3031632 RepID=UPI0038B6C923
MSSKRTQAKTPPKPVIVALGNAAMMLGVHDDVLAELAHGRGCQFYRDPFGRPGLTREDVLAIASSPECLLAIRKSLRREQRYRERLVPRAQESLARQQQFIGDFEGYAADLEAIHRRQLAAVNAAGAESAAMAAYLLLSKAISMLRMLTLALAHQHWYAGALLRDIDECLDAAKYFAITRDTPEGNKALWRWFHLNESPKHADMRAAGAEQLGLHLGNGNHRELLDELYSKKSKFTHPTFLAIREVARWDVSNGMALVEPSYGPCDEPDIIRDLTDFARSSFWSTYQIMLISLQITGVLASADRDLLLERDRAFQKLAGEDMA